jgi:hypothetical protein
MVAFEKNMNDGVWLIMGTSTICDILCDDCKSMILKCYKTWTLCPAYDCPIRGLAARRIVLNAMDSSILSQAV